MHNACYFKECNNLLWKHSFNVHANANIDSWDVILLFAANCKFTFTPDSSAFNLVLMPYIVSH